MRRRRGGTKTPRSVSVSASPLTTISACSGRNNPAIALISEVLPAPDLPNSAVKPPVLSKAASSWKTPNRWRTATLSILQPASPARRALAQRLGGKQSRHRYDDRHQGQPQCCDVSPGLLDKKVDRGRDCLGFARN